MKIEGTGASHPGSPASLVHNPGFHQAVQERMKWSRHALDRLAQRQIQLSPADEERLAEATRMAAKSGAKQAAVIMDQGIFIVAPQGGTVITGMTRTHEPFQLISNVDALVFVGRTISDAPSPRPTDGGSPPAALHWSLVSLDQTKEG